MTVLGRGEENRFVLDCYAILSFLEGGPGADRIRELMEMGKIQKASIATTVVNIGEALALVERERGLTSAQTALARIWDLPIQLHEVGEGLALSAARLQAQGNLPGGDSFALALARNLNATLLTGNPVYERAENLAAVEWL